MSDKDKTYDELLDESLAEVSKLETSRHDIKTGSGSEKIIVYQDTSTRIHPLSLLLAIIAIASLMLTGYYSLVISGDGIDEALANKIVFDDINNLPNSLRAKAVARSFTNFALSPKSKREWQILQEKLRETGEDTKLADTLSKVMTE